MPFALLLVMLVLSLSLSSKSSALPPMWTGREPQFDAHMPNDMREKLAALWRNPRDASDLPDIAQKLTARGFPVAAQTMRDRYAELSRQRPKVYMA